jgi:isocitrate dehydrogenase
MTPSTSPVKPADASSQTIPFIPGDGVGPEVWAASKTVFDAALRRRGHTVEWLEVLAGERAMDEVGDWLPDATLETIKQYGVAIKGPLTTPTGGGFRSLNVTMRQTLDLFACVRPIRYFPGVASPVVHPENVDIVVFRENTEDIYTGLELAAESPEADRLRFFCEKEFGWFLEPDGGIGLKQISKRRSERLQRAAIQYAIDHGRSRVTFVHKGNIMKYTEGAFVRWGHELAQREFSSVVAPRGEEAGPGQIVVDDIIADNAFQQLLLRPESFDILATMNLNGDYLSDAVAAQVGGIGIAPGGNINYDTGVGVFEATHGTAPLLAGKNEANPSSMILSGAMMFEHLGWTAAAQDIATAVETAIADGQVTGDLSTGSTSLSCQGYADAVAQRITNASQ